MLTFLWLLFLFELSELILCTQNLGLLVVYELLLCHYLHTAITYCDSCCEATVRKHVVICSKTTTRRCVNICWTTVRSCALSRNRTDEFFRCASSQARLRWLFMCLLCEQVLPLVLWRCLTWLKWKTLAYKKTPCHLPFEVLFQNM